MSDEPGDVPYDPSLRERLQRHLDAHDIREHRAEGLWRAAVSLIVVDSDAEAHGDVHPILLGLCSVANELRMKGEQRHGDQRRA